jgi:hypothetical protein
MTKRKKIQVQRYRLPVVTTLYYNRQQRLVPSVPEAFTQKDQVVTSFFGIEIFELSRRYFGNAKFGNAGIGTKES